ncbi:DoxX family protein [Mucilaginibacter sabulilitoris]|uniref:DoxX family protein n=1 Tax=Mucilaginibacter sabulilitoris TaxID=1173583 RepID=A0ABZ0TNR8_9SPHI|nr:DoxX family protein [Mucilaginibacter sabulilitoris]WPU94772.1 DoxX family protein [Mucilaginibacter sabulilitoris]
MIKTTFSIKGKDYRQWAPFVLRVITGLGFLLHGWAKLSRGPEGFAKLLTQLHIPFPDIMAWITTLTEILGGAALIAGIAVSLIAIPLICTMLVAMFGIHIHYGFSAVKTIGLTPGGPVFGPPGYEINLIYIASLISLMLTGGGRWSADSFFAKEE